MASAQTIYCEAEFFTRVIIERQLVLQEVGRVRELAVQRLQRVWRGYRVRREIRRWNRAATVIQKWTKRYLVRLHLPEMYHAYVHWYRVTYYNKMAARIQAFWKGYKYRKTGFVVKKILRDRAAVQRANEDIIHNLRTLFEETEKSKKETLEREARLWVLYILFKLHHHMRTQVREGIYSLHNSQKLSYIEQLFKVLPLREYMNDVRKTYYADLRRKRSPRDYRFKSRYMNVLEEAYANYVKTIAPRNPVIPKRVRVCEKPPKKSFNLYGKPSEKIYEREMLTGEDYFSEKFTFDRKSYPEKRVTPKDFDLHALKVVKFPEMPPPYYIDHWEKPCKIHDLPQS